MPTGTDTVVPTHPSNRSFISMLRAWGIEVEEGGEKWRAKLGDGNNLVVMAPHFHDGNPSAVFVEAYRALGVSAEQFWAGPQVEDKPPTTPKERKSKPRERYINKVADCLVQFGGPMSTERIAEELSLTTAQAGSACRQLLQQDVVELIKPGIYCAKQYAADARLAIDIDVSRAAAAAPEPPRIEVPALTSLDFPPAPLPPIAPPEPVVHATELSEAEVEDLMETVLDLIFPSGMHVRAADLKVIADWIESTKRLMYRVRAVES